MALRLAGFLTVMIATAAGFMPLPAPASVLASSRVVPRDILHMAVGAPGGESLAEQEFEVPAGCRKLRIPIPMGIGLEEIESGKGAVVTGFTEGSNGYKSGVKVGDVLLACSATSLKAGKEGAFTNTGYGGRPFDNWSVVMFPCSEAPFEQIMAALRSNNPRWGIKEVTLVLKPKPAASEVSFD